MYMDKWVTASRLETGLHWICTHSMGVYPKFLESEESDIHIMV
jgi:hypothetical protein